MVDVCVFSCADIGISCRCPAVCAGTSRGLWPNWAKGTPRPTGMCVCMHCDYKLEALLVPYNYHFSGLDRVLLLLVFRFC